MKNKLAKLAAYSYKDNQLEENIVNTIATKLTRNELKQYIRLIKQMESKKEISVIIPDELTKKEQAIIQKMFQSKRINYIKDPQLISGIRIIDNDMEYELSINQIFHDIITHLQHD